MTREFFARRWLKRHAVVYMTSHMMILPLVDLYATACDWWVAGVRQPPPRPLLVSHRQLSQWTGDRNWTQDARAGRRGARRRDLQRALGHAAAPSAHGCSPCCITAFAAWQAAARIGTEVPMLVLLVVLVGACGAVAFRVVRRGAPGSGKSIELDVRRLDAADVHRPRRRAAGRTVGR